MAILCAGLEDSAISGRRSMRSTHRYSPSGIMSPRRKRGSSRTHGTVICPCHLDRALRAKLRPSVPQDLRRDFAVSGAYGPEWVASIVNSSAATAVEARRCRRLGRRGRLVRSCPAPAARSDGPRPRVPFIVISPYARRHYVSHVQHEFGSLLKFTEDVFDLPRLDTTDVRLTRCATASISSSSRRRSPRSPRRKTPRSSCSSTPRPIPTTTTAARTRASGFSGS